jgi:outer membrane protein TolC
MQNGIPLTFKLIVLVGFYLVAFSPLKAQTTVLTEVSNVTLDTLIYLAKHNYPRMKYSDEQVAIARTNLQQAQNSWFDVFNLGYTKASNIGATSQNVLLFNGYQAGVNVNLGSLFSKPSLIREAKQEIKSAQYQKDELTVTIEAMVKERYYTYIKELTVLKLRMKTVQDAESVMFLMRTKFEKGEERFDSYNSIISSYTSQVQEKIDTETNMLKAKASLEELIGVKLETILNTDVKKIEIKR